MNAVGMAVTLGVLGWLLQGQPWWLWGLAFFALGLLLDLLESDTAVRRWWRRRLDALFAREEWHPGSLADRIEFEQSHGRFRSYLPLADPGPPAARGPGRIGPGGWTYPTLPDERGPDV